MKFKRIMESEQKFNTGDKVTFFGNPCTVVAVDLAGGKLASVTIKDDVAGWTNNVLVNDPNPITAKNFSHLKKVEGDGEMVNEGDENANGGAEPRVYVGTYGKYNDGSIDGEWVTLTDFDTYEEFVDYCKNLHKDEKNPEFMIQDFEGFPKAWYHESGLLDEATFDKIMEYYELSETEQGAYEAYLSLNLGNDDIESFRDAYRGRYSSPTDFAESLIDEMGFESAVGENADWYFDYEAFGRDLMMDFHMGDESNTDADGEPEDPDCYYDSDGYKQGEYESDSKVGEDFVDGMGSINELGQETIQRYFDFEKFGEELLMQDFVEEDGYYFWRH